MYFGIVDWSNPLTFLQRNCCGTRVEYTCSYYHIWYVVLTWCVCFDGQPMVLKHRHRWIQPLTGGRSGFRKIQVNAHFCKRVGFQMRRIYTYMSTFLSLIERLTHYIGMQSNYRPIGPEVRIYKRKQEKKKENTLSTKKMITKKKVFLDRYRFSFFSWSLSWFRACFLSFFLFV